MVLLGRRDAERFGVAQKCAVPAWPSAASSSLRIHLAATARIPSGSTGAVQRNNTQQTSKQTIVAASAHPIHSPTRPTRRRSRSRWRALASRRNSATRTQSAPASSHMAYHWITHLSGCIGIICWMATIGFAVDAARGLHAYRADQQRRAGGLMARRPLLHTPLPLLLRMLYLACTIFFLLGHTGQTAANWLHVSPRTRQTDVVHQIAPDDLRLVSCAAGSHHCQSSVTLLARRTAACLLSCQATRTIWTAHVRCSFRFPSSSRWPAPTACSRQHTCSYSCSRSEKPFDSTRIDNGE